MKCEPRERTRTNGHGECRGAEKADAEKTVAPSGHDDARQPLSELRRMVDAERHRIRGKLVGVRRQRHRDERPSRHAQWIDGEMRDDVMAETLAVVRLLRNRFARRGFGALRPLLLLMPTAIPKNAVRVSCQHEQGYDGDEEAGAQKTHEWAHR